MGCDRQAGDGAGDADGVVDGGGDGGAHRVDAALARALQAERIERGWRILRDQHVEDRHFARGRHQVVGEIDRQRLAALVVEEFLEQRAADPLREAAGELTLDQHRIDGAAYVVGQEIALDGDAAGLTIDAHHGGVNPVGIVHVVGVEPTVGGEPGRAGAAQLRRRVERLGDLAERHRGPGRCSLAHDLAVDHLERGGGLLQELRRHLDRLGPHVDRGEARRLAGHDRHPRGEGALPERDAVGAAMHHPHAPIIDPERVGADLRNDGLDPLPDRGRAGDHLHEARAVDGDAHAFKRPEPALLDEQSEPRAHVFAGGAATRQLCRQRVPLEHGESLVEQPGIIAGIEHDLGAERDQRPRIGHLGLGDQVASAHLDAVDAETHRDGVEQALARERALEAAGRPIGATRRLVGEAHVANHAIGRDVIRAGQHARGEIRHGGGVGAHIAALVVEELVFDPEDAPFGIDRGAQLVALLARVVGRDQMLAPILDPLDRAVEPQRRDADQHVLGVELAPDAEAAADVSLIEMHG